MTARSTSAGVTLPPWVWGGNPNGFLANAKLHQRVGGDGSRAVQSQESYLHQRQPGLVESAVALDKDFEPGPGLTWLKRSSRPDVEGPVRAALREHPDFPDEPTAPSGLAAVVNYLQVIIAMADDDVLEAQARASLESLRMCRFEKTGDPVFPNSSVFVVRRSDAILHRLKLAQLTLRMNHGGEDAAKNDLLRQGRDGLVFASSQGLSMGSFLMDVYLAPLLSARSPGVWAFSVPRGGATLIYSYGRPASGTNAIPNSLLATVHRSHTATARQYTFSDFDSMAAPESALTWWTARLDQMFATTTNPGAYADRAGKYNAVLALQVQLSVEQVFARTATALVNYNDTATRLPTAFTVLDTLESLTGIRTDKLFRHSYAAGVLKRLLAELPAPAAEILIPSAEQAVEALRSVQDGFFIRDANDGQGVVIGGKATDLETAAGWYVGELRNAAHGFTTNRLSRQAKVGDLLTKHDGTVDSDLGLLAWLYLLDLLSQPDRLSACISRTAASAGAPDGGIWETQSPP